MGLPVEKNKKKKRPKNNYRNYAEVLMKNYFNYSDKYFYVF